MASSPESFETININYFNVKVFILLDFQRDGPKNIGIYYLFLNAVTGIVLIWYK